MEKTEAIAETGKGNSGSGLLTKVIKKPRSPSAIRVSPATEWTDFHGLLELFGIRRSTGYHLVREGRIKSISLKNKGEKRGKRLFHVPSVRIFLTRQMLEAIIGSTKLERENSQLESQSMR